MTNNKRTIRRVAAAAALTFAFSAAVAPWVVFAATVTWTGVTGGPCLPGANVWSLNGSFGPCWSNGSGPANGDDVLLSLNGPSLPSTYDINRTFNSLTLNTSTVAATPGYTVSNAGGFVLGLQSGGFITDNNTRGPDAINTGITLNGPATFTLSAGATQLSFGGNATIGAGPLTLVNNGANDGLALNVANTYTGATTVNGTGRVKASVNGAIPTGSAVTVNSGASLLFGASSTIGSLVGGGTVALGSTTLTAGGDNTSTTFSGVLSGTGGLTKAGSGTLTLSGTNTYIGTTTVNAGTLVVANGGTVSGNVTVNAGGTLIVNGTVTGTITNNGGTVTGTAFPATRFMVTGPATATAGTAFNLTVTALNQFNGTATGYAGTARFTSSDGAAALPANSTLTNGTGTFSATLKTVGNQTITATDTVTASITGTTANIAVSAGAATHLTVTAPATATAGTAFNFTVTALDAFNNTATGYAGTVKFTSSDGAAVVPANSTLTNGTGTFSAT